MIKAAYNNQLYCINQDADSCKATRYCYIFSFSLHDASKLMNMCAISLAGLHGKNDLVNVGGITKMER